MISTPTPQRLTALGGNRSRSGPSPQQQTRPRALIVVPEAFNGPTFTTHFERLGFDVSTAPSGAGVRAEISRVRPHVIFLHLTEQNDAMFALCAELRQTGSTPIIACSTTHELSQIVESLRAGADDFFVLPMRPAELVARVRAVARRVRRARGGPEDRLVAGDVEVRPREHRAYRNGELLDLSPTDFRLLTALVRNPGRTVSGSRLVEQAWGVDQLDSDAMLRIYIRRLRTKLGDHSLIASERGIGYRFEPALPETLASSAA